MHTCRTQLSQIIASRPVAPPTPQADGGGGGRRAEGEPPTCTQEPGRIRGSPIPTL